VLERGLLTRAQLDDILNPAAMTAPRNVTQEFSTVGPLA